MVARWKVAIVICLVLLGVCCLTMIVVGLTLRELKTGVQNFPDFAEANCTLARVNITELKDGCVSSDPGGMQTFVEWIAVWERAETGTSVVIDPFAGRAVAALAEDDAEDYPLDTVRCMCSTGKVGALFPTLKDVMQCQVWGVCMLNVELVEELQRSAQQVHGTGTVLVLVGGICALVLGVGLCGFGLYWCFNSKQISCLRRQQYKELD